MPYTYELEGQTDFYETYLSRIDSSKTVKEVLEDNNDGVINGNIIEFKLNINDLNSTLFQVIKYLSQRRIKGKPIPANIVLISLNDGIAYLYKSEDYLANIEQTYNVSASKENSGFIINAYNERLCYVSNTSDEERLIQILRENNYTKIHIDENCIVGWARKFYSENRNAQKGDFIGDLTGSVRIVGEIRKPNKFKDYIYPYPNRNNVKFEYLMDKLNDDLQKINLGAFYTPKLYVEKSIELLRQAIERVPNGNDYVIIDRCAGTGNLEKLLTKDELSHVIVSTLEYYEYKVLVEVLGDKVRHVIPPSDREDTFNIGLVRGADALSEEYINNELLNKYINNKKCTIILFENPPYSEPTSLEHQRQNINNTTWKTSFIYRQMKEEVSGQALNDLGNLFIWSAFKYYLRQPTDSYIVYSPVKYWKAQHLINKKFLNGFAFNRKHFHTNTNACVSCILWANEIDDIETFTLQAFDIKNEQLVEEERTLPINKISSLFSERYYDRTPFHIKTEDGILTALNGLEATNQKKRIKPLYSDEMLGYMVADSCGFDNPDAKSSLLVAGRYNGNGFYLHRDRYLDKLPMFCASRYIKYNSYWTERARIMKSADGAEKYIRDVNSGKLNQYLLKCLLFTCIEPQNHMKSFTGSDERFYRNELCLDNTNGETIASRDLVNLKKNRTEQEILRLWYTILDNAKNTENYKTELTYGLYQIDIELNTFDIDERTGGKTYHYPELNGNIKTLKQMTKEYYNSEIVPTLFKYEFLK